MVRRVCGTRNFVRDRAQMSVQTHASAEIVEHAIDPGRVHKFAIQKVFPMRTFFGIEIEDERMLFPGCYAFDQRTRRVFAPGLQDPNGVGVTFQQRFHDRFANR